MPDSLRVLYAEDDAFDAEQLATYVAAHAPDLRLDIVKTGVECLARLAGGQYDALLLDNRLPDMDGAEVLKELAAREQTLPIVVVTGVGDEELVVQVLGLGAMDYLPKHGDYFEIVPTMLRKAVTEHRNLPEGYALGHHRPRRVLYVERHVYDVDLTLAHFAHAARHLMIEIARSASDALLRLEQDAFDLVLTDLRMADLSALDLLKTARSRGIAVPFIVITGQGDEQAAVAAMKLGAYDYIVKRDNYLTQLPYAIDQAISRSELELVNRQLEAQLAERKKAESTLREHAVALADAARQKEEFLAMLGHELRNPLAPIRTALELLRRFSTEHPLAIKAHQVVDRQITHMVRLLDDVLDVARITSGRIQLHEQELDLRAALAEAIDSTRPLIDARKHRLRMTVPDDPLIVRGDATRLVQVMVNLLNNAAKYTDEGGTIDITATQEGASAVVRVTDTGAGVSARLLPKIFDLFTQDDRTLDRAQGGLGLGLTLVRRITELHGGSVKAHSDGLGRGSTFTIALPLLVPQEVAACGPTSRCEPSAPAPMRCLIVEDNVDAAEMLRVALELEGHTVSLAFDGRDAIAAASSFAPDVILLDIGLPRLNGYDAARAIRQISGLQDVVIIAATGYGQDADRRKSSDAGINQHLVKPVTLAALRGAIAAARGTHSDHSLP